MIIHLDDSVTLKGYLTSCVTYFDARFLSVLPEWRYKGDETNPLPYGTHIRLADDKTSWGYYPEVILQGGEIRVQSSTIMGRVYVTFDWYPKRIETLFEGDYDHPFARCYRKA
jgi:hypothetical protein